MTSNTSRPVRRQSATPLDKIVATIAAIPLVAAETGLNAEHLAITEGWLSTLVLGAVGATLAAAIALPIAERALARGCWLKAMGLGLFFVIMLAFSFTTSVGRVGSKADGDVAAGMGHNGKLKLAEDAYLAAQKTRGDECKTGRGSRCRAAEDAVTAARAALIAAPAAVAVGSMTKRLSAATGFSEATVALYQPLLFPLALQIGGFFFLAYGFAPATRAERPIIELVPIVTETQDMTPNVTVIEKPKRVRKTKPKALTYQPAIMAKMDGRKTRGMKQRVANENADFVPANVNA